MLRENSMPNSEKLSWSRNPLLRASAIVGGSLAVLVVVVYFVFTKPAFPTMVQVSVALGTGLLGAAAIYQTVSENERKRIDESNRQTDRAPHIRIMDDKRVVDHIVDFTDPAGKRGKKSVKFAELEVFVENVGPGIAGGLSGILVCMYFEIDYSQDYESIEDERERHQDLKGVLNDRPSFEERELRLPSTFLPVGVSERMKVINADEERKWLVEQNDRDPRAYIVQISCTDLEGHPAQSATAAIYWIPPQPKRWRVEEFEAEFDTSSRWYRPSPESEALIIDAWNGWKLAHKKG
jgi:hypothetical protein